MEGVSQLSTSSIRADDEPGLSDYLAILRRRWLLAVLAFAVVTVPAVMLSLQAEQRYRSDATVLVFTSFSQSLFPAPPGNASRLYRNTANELEFARSSTLTDVVQLPVGYDLTVDVGGDTNSDSLTFSVTGPDPVVAAEFAGSFATAYVASREQQVESNLSGSLSALETSIAELEAQRDELLEPLAPLDDALARETDADTISRLTTQRLTLLQSLDDDLNPIRGQLSILNTERSQLTVLVDYLRLNDDTGARLLGAAGDGVSVTPPLERNLVLAILAGIGLAVVAVVVAESLVDRIRVEQDVERALPGIPVLATLPDVGKKLSGPISWESINEIRPYRVALDRLLTSLRFAAQGADARSLAIVAAREDVGKSTVALSLALAVANGGDTVLLVDGDGHRSSVERLSGVSLPEGMSEIVAGSETIESAAFLLPASERIALIGPGSVGIDPGDMWRAATAGPIMGKLCSAADLVVFDTPPLLAVSDAFVIGAGVDSCILLARAKRSRVADLQKAAQRLAFSGAQVAGVVLVGGKVDSEYSYYGEG